MRRAHFSFLRSLIKVLFSFRFKSTPLGPFLDTRHFLRTYDEGTFRTHNPRLRLLYIRDILTGRIHPRCPQGGQGSTVPWCAAECAADMGHVRAILSCGDVREASERLQHRPGASSFPCFYIIIFAKVSLTRAISIF